MGNVFMCIGRYAKRSYPFSELGVSIYSVEELSYLLYEQGYLLDKDSFSESLVDWIRNECQEAELANLIQRMVELHKPFYQMVKEIQVYIGFYNEEEISNLERLLEQYEKLSSVEKKVAQIDLLLKKKQYLKAMQSYEKICAHMNEETQEVQGKVHYNYGYCKVQMFQFESAAHSFFHAYDMTGNIKHYKAYLCALRLSMSDKEYISFVGEHKEAYQLSLEMERELEEKKHLWGVSDQFFTLDMMKKMKMSGGMSVYEKMANEQLAEIQKSYHNNS